MIKMREEERRKKVSDVQRISIEEASATVVMDRLTDEVRQESPRNYL